MTLPPDARTTYIANDPPEDAPRARKHELVRQVKRLIEHTAHLDVEAVADMSVVDALIADVGAAADRIAALPDLHARGGLASSGGADSALLERSGISGRSNPLAPPVQWHVGTHRTVGHAVYTDAYEGPIGCLHGGFVAAAFDDLMGAAQTMSSQAGYTGTLTVRMRRPTPLNRRIDYEAGIDRTEGRKIYVWGTASCDGEVLAEADIVFIAPADGRTAR